MRSLLAGAICNDPPQLRLAKDIIVSAACEKFPADLLIRPPKDGAWDTSTDIQKRRWYAKNCGVKEWKEAGSETRTQYRIRMDTWRGEVKQYADVAPNNLVPDARQQKDRGGGEGEKKETGRKWNSMLPKYVVKYSCNQLPVWSWRNLCLSQGRHGVRMMLLLN